MALRVQLINEFVGSIVLDMADPVGINEMTQTVKRSADNEGVVYEVILDLDFIKQGRRFLKESFEDHGGIDAEVLVNVFEYDTNLRKWMPYANGKVNFQKYSVYEDKITVNIEQIGFQRRVLNLLETDVDLSATSSQNGSAIPETLFNDALYHSKTILRESTTVPQDSGEHQFLDQFTINIPNDPQPSDPVALAIWLAAGHPFSVYRDTLTVGSIDNGKALAEELPESFSVEFSFVNAGSLGDGAKTNAQYITYLTANKDNRFERTRVKEAGILSIEDHVNLRHHIEVSNSGGDVDTCGGSTALGNTEIIYWFEVRDKNDNILLLVPTSRETAKACGTNEFDYYAHTYTQDNISLNIGDKIYIYHTLRVWGYYEQPTGISDGHIHHDIVVQSAPPKWLPTPSYGLGDRVIYNGSVWDSLVSDNAGHAPEEGTFWTLESDWTGSEVGTGTTIKSSTKAPETTAKTILLHDAFLKCCQYITNQVDCFKSNLLGRTELGYAVDGDGALIGWTNGGALRKLPSKKIFANLKELIDFTDSLFCVGFGFEIENGRSILRVERRSFFYDKNTKVLSLGKVYNIKKTLDQKKFNNEIEYGYQGKIDIGQVNAVDAFNTVRKAALPIVNTKNKINVSTKVRTDGYLIENQRRLQFSTADSKLDDEKFAVVLIRSGGGFKTKKDEGYASIINVLDPATGYNYDISPARNLKNWYQYIAATLVRSASKLVKFTYGEVNYIMASQKTGEAALLHEDGTFDLTGVEPLFEPFTYAFSAPMTREQFRILKANPYGYIEFEDQFGQTLNGFVSDGGIEHDSFQGKADFELLHVYRP